MNGRELRGWSNGTTAAVKRINEQPARADIEIRLGATKDGKLPVDVRAKSAMTGQLFIALYENELTSHVRAGESRGAALRHDYVAREWLGPVTLTGEANTQKAEFAGPLALPDGAMERNLGVAAFVQRENGEVLQTVALDICGAR